jgi:hypothetical protein
MAGVRSAKACSPTTAGCWPKANSGNNLAAARRCFAYGVKNANGEGGSPTYFQVHSANGAMHENVFMNTDLE